MKHEKSHALFSRATQLIPGGVNSPVRAFKSVGGEPFFVASADGAWLHDVDGNRYIDYVGSWGPMIAATLESFGILASRSGTPATLGDAPSSTSNSKAGGAR